MTPPSGAGEPRLESALPERPATLLRIVIVGLLALMAGIAAVCLISNRPRATYSGLVTARVIPVIAADEGVLAQWLVSEGDAVRIGDPIASIANASLLEKRRRAEQEIARLKIELERALAQAELDLEWRMKDVNAAIFATRLQSAELLEQKYRYEMEKVALTDVLSSNATALWMPSDSVFDSVVLQDKEKKQGRLSTVLRAEAASNSADVCSAQVEMCEEQITALEQLRDALPERVRRSVGVDVLERQLDAAEDELERLSTEQAETMITSRVIGQVGVFLRQPGAYVRLGERIVEVFDDVQRYIVVEVPSGEAHPFQVGREFPLTFPGKVRRTGRVARVAPQAIAADGASGTVVRVHLEPAGRLWPHVPLESQVLVSVP